MPFETENPLGEKEADEVGATEGQLAVTAADLEPAWRGMKDGGASRRRRPSP